MKLSAPLIYGLIVCILLVSAPHAAHLPLWVSALSVLLLSWRAYLTYSGNALPSRRLLVFVTLVCVAGLALSFHTLFGRDVGVMLLILLGSLKLLELHETRDATILLYLCCFVIITNFFYSQSIATALFMLLTLLTIMSTWLLLHTGELTLKPRIRIASIMLLQAIPLALLIFALFPRIQGPLWGMPQDAYGKSGLSDSMSPGSLSKLSLSDAVAFRVTFAGKKPPQDKMYWRGPVLWDFDGRTWTHGHNASLRTSRLDKVSQTVRYTVTLEPHNKHWLFALDMPIHISIPAVFSPDYNLLNKTPINTRLRYDATSLLSYLANLDESSQQLQRALALPDGFNPQARQLAAQWRAQNLSNEAIVKTALAYFNRNGFEYTLEPPPIGRNGVDDFLFETRKGFCEYYASSFVFLMRAAGIPARVVTGYQGGEFNSYGNYYILRQSDAHAWTEVWLKDKGWVRYDPTASIAPSRIRRGLNAALPDSTALSFFARTQSPFLLKLRFNLDALNNQWNQWVLGYNSERQFAFLTRLGMQDVTWQKLVTYMLIAAALLVGIFTLFMLRRLTAHHNDVVQATWLKLCRKLEKAGLARAPHEGAQDYASRISAARPELATNIQNISSQYMVLRYSEVENNNLLKAFKIAVKTFPK